MDTSKKYIKMCEEFALSVPEVVEEKELQLGDVYAYLRPLPGEVWYTLEGGVPASREEWIKRKWKSRVEIIQADRDDGVTPVHHYIDTIERCWLPRQDQLQEMVIKEQGWKLHPRDIKTLLHNVCLSIEKRLPPFNKPGFYSMEQLWLAFVMKEKYNKIWKNDKWSSQPKK